MNDLVTGGAGFIGSHLARRLLDEGRTVQVLDDLSTGRIDNIADLLEKENFRFAVGSVCDRDLVNALVKEADRVFHLAAVVGVMKVLEDPAATISINVGGAETVLAAAARLQKPVLVTSSSEVYGPRKESKAGLKEEEALPARALAGPRWAYAFSKRVNETRALELWGGAGLPAVIARLFNIVGPVQRGDGGMVLPRFVDQALSGEEITVFGDGSQSRCFTWVGDAVEALVRLMDHSGAAGRAVNVGTREETTILELALAVGRMVSLRPPRIRFVPYEEAYGPDYEDTPSRRPDTARLEKLAGFVPETPLETALSRILGKTAAARCS